MFWRQTDRQTDKVTYEDNYPLSKKCTLLHLNSNIQKGKIVFSYFAPMWSPPSKSKILKEIGSYIGLCPRQYVGLPKSKSVVCTSACVWVIPENKFWTGIGIIIRVSGRCSCIEWQAIPFNRVIGQSQQSWAHLTNTEKVLAWLGWGRYHRATATAPCPESCQVRLMTHILLTIFPTFFTHPITRLLVLLNFGWLCLITPLEERLAFQSSKARF